MDVQHALLSKIILDGEIVYAVKSRITTEFFTDDKYRRVFEYLTKHWNDYGTPPDEAVVKSAFPAERWKVYPQPIAYFVDQMRERRKLSILTEGLSEAATLLNDEGNPDATDQMEMALQIALTRARLETASSYDFDFSTSKAQMSMLLDERAAQPGYLRGISTGFDGIDYVTGGLQPEQFVVLLGTPKSFKSATLLAVAMAVQRQVKTALFVGFEMSNVEQSDRSLSLLSGVSLTRIMTGTYSLPERRLLDLAMSEQENMMPLVFSTDITSATTVSGIQAKIQEYQPDVCFIDGAYLMDAEVPNVEKGSPQALTSISRGLKRLAQSQRIPIVVTTQASLVRSRSGLTLASAMYTQAWGQDADLMLGVERQGDDDNDSKAEAEVKFKVIASRSGPRKEITLLWNWDEGSVTEHDGSSLQDPRTTPMVLVADDDDPTIEWEAPSNRRRTPSPPRTRRIRKQT